MENNMKSLNDSELVNLIKEKRDEKAFQEIIDRYSQKIYNLSFRITRNKEDAEEALQDTFLAIFSKIDSFKEESTFSSWLYRVTSNAAFMTIRKRKKTEAISLDNSEEAIPAQLLTKNVFADVNHLTTKHELQNRLQLAILKLPKEYQEIFIMRDIDKIQNKRIAKMLKLSIPAIKAKLHRARLILRKELQAYYEDYTTDKDVFVSRKTATVKSMVI